MPATSVLHLSVRDARRVPWKNGRGFTDELALGPEGSSFERGDFDWRIAKAAIAAAGPFSPFAGFERILLVTSGAGLALAHGAHAPRVRLRPLEPYRFAGDWETTCELVAGPVTDLNVLFRPERLRADVEVLALGRRRALETLTAGHALAHVLAGSTTARVAGEEEPFVLRAGESLCVRDLAKDTELELAGSDAESTVVLVRLGACP